MTSEYLEEKTYDLLASLLNDILALTNEDNWNAYKEELLKNKYSDRLCQLFLEQAKERNEY